MKTAIAIAGWVFAGLFLALAVVAGVTAIYQHDARQEDMVLLFDSYQDLAEESAKAEALEVELAEYRSQVGQLEAEIASLEALNAQLEPGTTETAALPEDQSAEKWAEMFQDMAANAQDGEEVDFGSLMKNMQQLLTSEEGKGMMDFGIQMQMGQQYGDLFAMLSLPPDKEQQVKDILTQYMRTEMERGMAMWDKDARPSMEELQAQSEAVKADLNNQLASVLDPQQLQTVEEYNATMPQRMMEKNFDLQLSIYGESIPEDVRPTVRQVLVEEFTGQFAQGDMSQMQADPSGAINFQIEALARARDRLSTAYDAETNAAIEAFLQQQEQMLEMAGSMFEGFGGTE
ncbi:MAG: hypothetical protein KJ052_06565 [Candidatus Hydrogenedentes bacterium]|nr:hypothetical protein [Candidatus Hydrogenedentota bacterium]